MNRKASIGAKASFLSLAAALFVSIGSSRTAEAQVGLPPLRDKGWKNITGAAVALGAVDQLLMPRIFYPDPEVTVGWKARWHISVLAPVMTITALAFINEYQAKSFIKGFRPNCDDTNQNKIAGCNDYGSPSTHVFAASAALGHGTAVFLVDTIKWSGGRVNAGSIIGNIVVPLITTAVTFVGRGVGNWETPSENIFGGAVGLVSGAVLGVVYATMQRPECGYSGALFCW